MPPLAGDGWMIIGDSAGFLNSQRLKGIHLAIKSGMLAAETAFDALLAGNFSAAQLQAFQAKVDESWIKRELYPVRNFHQGFEGGLLQGMAHAALQQISGGRGLMERYPAHAGHKRMRTLPSHAAGTNPSRSPAGPRATANLPSTSSPTSITPARATRKISPRTW